MLLNLLVAVTFAASMLLTTGAVSDGNNGNRVRAVASLRPTSEVPALWSQAHGRLKATIDQQNQTISYELSYDGLEGDVLQAHIHLGQRGVNGGVSVFLCGNPPNVPAAPAPLPPPCPAPPATVTGELTAANIIGPAAQGIEPTSATVNEFGDLVNMLLSGATYANVHSSKFPGGEVRGQVRVVSGK
jgi:hypothetical protein